MNEHKHGFSLCWHWKSQHKTQPSIADLKCFCCCFNWYYRSSPQVVELCHIALHHLEYYCYYLEYIDNKPSSIFFHIYKMRKVTAVLFRSLWYMFLNIIQRKLQLCCFEAPCIAWCENEYKLIRWNIRWGKLQLCCFEDFYRSIQHWFKGYGI